MYNYGNKLVNRIQYNSFKDKLAQYSIMSADPDILQ